MKPVAWIIGTAIVVAVLVRRLTRTGKAHDKEADSGSRPIQGVGTNIP
jgi:hypothetical protein